MAADWRVVCDPQAGEIAQFSVDIKKITSKAGKEQAVPRN
jgi:hypothetical protein